ncbi:MAG: DUF5357 family protein, partial [Leptolyngbyaceae bacterium]|nr:DUF5357 family protein [Leptolyngbyaceae bacterium]
MNWLLKQLNDAVRQLFDTFWPKQAFSWQTVFWLSLLSWGLTGLSYYNIDAGLLPPDSPAPSTDTQDFSRELVGTPRILFTMAWVFLTIAIGWVLAGRKWKLPIFDITLKPAIWVTSALTSLFLFEIWDADTRPLVFIAWPIIFAIYTVLPKIFQLSTGNFILPPPPIRQQLVITTLICLVISCLFRFHFIIQNWIAQEYQVLQLIDFDEGGVMQQVADPSPVLTVANLTLQNELGVLSIPEVRRWMLQADEREAELNEAFLDNLNRAPGVFPVWELNLRVDAVSEPKFHLFTWPTRRDTTIG